MAGWTRVADAAEIPDGEMLAVTVGDVSVAIYNANGLLLATDNICSHAFAALTDGYFDPDDCTVECPLHAARFDLQTGSPLEPPATDPIRTYPVKIEDGALLVDLG